MAIHIAGGNLSGGKTKIKIKKIKKNPKKHTPPHRIRTHELTPPPTAMASNFYRARDSPRYVLGHGLEIGFVCLGIGAVGLLMFNYTRINRRRARQLAAGEQHTFTARELSDLGDRAITFRYML